MAGRMTRFRAAAHAGNLSKALQRADPITMWGLTVIIISATSWAFGESYRGLFALAINYLHLHEPWAAGYPIIIDWLIALGELRLFLCALRGDTRWRTRGWAWIVTTGALTVSILGNAVHDGLHAGIVVKLGSAVAPLVATIALGIGLGLVKDAVAKAKAAEELRRQPKPKRPVVVTEHTEKQREKNVVSINAKRGPKPKLDTDPAMRQLVQEISKEIRKGTSFTERGLREAYGLSSRHIARQVLAAARGMAQEVASG
jgi:hypothetical protein